MNIFNRVVMSVLLLSFAVGSIALIFTSLLFPHEAIGNMRDALVLFDENVTWGFRILVSSAATLLAVVSLLILFLEVIPRPAKGVRLVGVTGASAQLTVEAITGRLRYDVEAIPSVRQVRPRVVGRGKEVDVDLDVRMDPTIDIAAKTEEVSQVTRDAVENQMGIKLRRLRVFVQHEPYAKNGKGKSIPPASVPAQQPTSSLDIPFGGPK